MTTVFIYSFFIMLASLAGVLTVWTQAGNIIARNLNTLVSFSAGVFLIVAYELAGETIEHAGRASEAVIWIGGGAVGIWLIFRFLPMFHHHHGEKDSHHAHTALDTRKIIVSDAIHNFGDGILLATSFGISSELGIITALSIFVHELVQEISEFFVLRQGGYSVKRALVVNFITSTTILLGAIVGYTLLESSEAFEVPLLGIAAGSFFIVVLHDLIPHSIRASENKREYATHAVWFLIGAVLMAGISTVAVHPEVEHSDTNVRNVENVG